jgi:hypothetical protein
MVVAFPGKRFFVPLRETIVHEQVQLEVQVSPVFAIPSLVFAVRP